MSIQSVSLCDSYCFSPVQCSWFYQRCSSFPESQHGYRCSCRMHSISTVLIPESYHLYATWRCTCLGSWVPCWRWQFFQRSLVYSSKVSPSLPWLDLCRLSRLPAALRLQLVISGGCWSSVLRQHGAPSMLITVRADLSSWILKVAVHELKDISVICLVFFSPYCKKFRLHVTPVFHEWSSAGSLHI